MAYYMTEGKYHFAKHLMYVNNTLLDAVAKKKKRIIINMPPRHGKSELVCKYFPVWYLGNNPDKKVLITMHSSDLANKYGGWTRDLFVDYGKSLFGLEVSKSTKSKSSWEVAQHQGGVEAHGWKGSITGKGADVLIIDDLIKNYEEAFSTTYREAMKNWFASTAFSRLSPNAIVILIMTRWHYDDIAGYLQEEYPETWEVINFPAIAESDDVLGRKKGDYLWPERFGKEYIEEQMKVQGSFFTSLYQQKPVITTSLIFDPSNWQYYKQKPKDLRDKLDYVIQVWDTAFKESETNDYSVCLTIGIDKNHYYILDVFRKKLNFNDLEKNVVRLYEYWNADKLYVEDAGSGQSLIQTMPYRHGISVKAVKTMNKVVRANMVSSPLENRTVYLPLNMSWVTDFINELARFPSGKHDDQVDVYAIAMQILMKLMEMFTRGTKSYSSPKKKTKQSITEGFM
jgi:predicted phage terminase large subunit-like protein